MRSTESANNPDKTNEAGNFTMLKTASQNAIQTAGGKTRHLCWENESPCEKQWKEPCNLVSGSSLSFLIFLGLGTSSRTSLGLYLDLISPQYKTTSVLSFFDFFIIPFKTSFFKWDFTFFASWVMDFLPKALPDNIGSWFSACNLSLTQLERRPQKKWKTT